MLPPSKFQLSSVVVKFTQQPLTSCSSSYYSFPSVLCFRRQFLLKSRLIQLAFHRFVVWRMVLSFLTLCNASFFTRSVQLVFFILLQHQQSNTLKLFLIYFTKCVGPSTKTRCLLLYSDKFTHCYKHIFRAWDLRKFGGGNRKNPNFFLFILIAPLPLRRSHITITFHISFIYQML